jgi:hypothetical protein
MSAKVVFLERQLSDAERKPIVAVNRQAIRVKDDGLYVYVLDADRVREVKLTITAEAMKTDLVPVSQLSPGQRVVIRPGDLADGQRVKIQNP